MEPAVTRSRLFALIIGIDKYRSSAIRALRGAVADARAVQAYLQDRHNVPNAHIKMLENESATRDAILQGLQLLVTDTRIRHGDAIVLYYAGHGSEAAAPPEWEAGGPKANIQLTLPYDVYCKSGDQTVAPIPDRTLGALLEAIAQAKGNNISVIMDSCYSASGTRTSHHPTDFVRFVPLPSGFYLRGDLDHSIWASFRGLRSHILLSACSSGGQALEHEGRGVFTVGLLAVLEEEHDHIDTLSYRHILMDIDIDTRQNPHGEGFNLDSYIFTTTVPPPYQCFFPGSGPKARRGSNVYIITGGTVHGLAVGDEFSVLDHRLSTESVGTLIIEETGSFVSIVRPRGLFPPTGRNSIAVPVKESKRQPLHIYTSGDSIQTIHYLLQDSAQDFSNFVIVHSLEDYHIDISMRDNQLVFRSGNMNSSQGFCINPTAEELSRILKASWQFFSELRRTADFPDIKQHVKIEICELQMSRHSFPGSPTAELQAVPCEHGSETLVLLQGTSYGLKLTNNSDFNLYPTVKYFDPNNEFKIDTWYQLACSRSRLDVPLMKRGGTLTIGYGSGGSPPLVIPSSGIEGHVFLKVSLFSHPPDPFYDIASVTNRPYDYFKLPWATITRSLTHRRSDRPSSLPVFQQHPQEFVINKPPELNPKFSRASVPYGHYKSAPYLDLDPQSSTPVNAQEVSVCPLLPQIPIAFDLTT